MIENLNDHYVSSSGINKEDKREFINNYKSRYYERLKFESVEEIYNDIRETYFYNSMIDNWTLEEDLIDSALHELEKEFEKLISEKDKKKNEKSEILK